MKTALLIAASLLPLLSFSQNCQRDSNLLLTGALFSPAPWTPDSPFYNLHPACINELYGQSITVNVPNSITISGVTVPISNVSIPTSNGIQYLPVGLTYSCDPPNCVFNANTLGCVQLYGTPDASNSAPDTLDLILTAVVATPIGAIPTTFPNNQATPNDHYYLTLGAAGQCSASATKAPGGSLFENIRALPNPFTGQTRLEAQVAQSGDYQFEVFDLFGRCLHIETVYLSEGDNQFIYDGSQLPEGAYFFSLGNVAARSAWRMIKL